MEPEGSSEELCTAATTFRDRGANRRTISKGTGREIGLGVLLYASKRAKKIGKLDLGDSAQPSRKVAVGGTLCRLIAKVAAMKVSEEMGALLAPVQLGYGIKGGSEAAVHAFAQYMRRLGSNCVLKLDFKYAFNCIRRDKCWRQSRVLRLSYTHSSTLHTLHPRYYSGKTRPSTPQRVCSKGTLWALSFSASLYTSYAKSELCIFYLDDGTLGGKVEDVVQDLDLIVHKGAELGLHLNPQKLEIVCHDDTSRGLVLNALPGAQVIDSDNATLLGSPIGDVACISAILEDKIGMLRTMGDRLKLLFSHDAILLLCHSFEIPKLLYIHPEDLALLPLTESPGV